jgi:hypothetical protein
MTGYRVLEVGGRELVKGKKKLQLRCWGFSVLGQVVQRRNAAQNI